VLCITETDVDGKALRLWARSFGVDLFVISISQLPSRCKELNTVLLDAVTQGKVLFDNLHVLPRLRHTLSSLLKEKGLTRTPKGWLKSSKD